MATTSSASETPSSVDHQKKMSSNSKCSSHFVHINGIPTKVMKVDGQHGIGDTGIRGCMEGYVSNVIFLVIPGNFLYKYLFSSVVCFILIATYSVEITFKIELTIPKIYGYFHEVAYIQCDNHGISFAG